MAIFAGAGIGATDAHPDLVEAAFLRLARQVGIGQRGASHGHQVGVAVAHDLVGQAHVGDATHGNDRDAHGALDGRRGIDVEPPIDGRWRHHSPQRGADVADGDVQQVDAGLFQSGADADRVLQAQAGAQRQFVADDAKADREIGSHHLAYPRHHLQRKAQALVKCAAILVLAAVKGRRQELVDQIAVGAVDLDRVEPGFLGAAGSLPKGFHQVLDLGDCQGMGHHAHTCIGDGRGGDDKAARVLGLGADTAVVELERNLGPMLVYGRGQPPKAGDLVVIVDADLGRHAPPARIDRGVLDDDQADAALGAPPVVGDQLVCHFMLGRPVAGVHRRDDNAVADRHAVDANGLKKVFHESLLWITAGHGFRFAACPRRTRLIFRFRRLSASAPGLPMRRSACRSPWQTGR